MEEIKLNIRGISYSEALSGSYTLILEDPISEVKVLISIGNFEAQSISVGLEKDLEPPRPLTHDLFRHFLLETGFTIERIMIYKFSAGVFYSRIYFLNEKTGAEFSLDARTSDAVAMAVRYMAPIIMPREVLIETGIQGMKLIEDEPEENKTKETVPDLECFENPFEFLSMQELEEQLQQAEDTEDYDIAALLQEEIERRHNSID